PTNQGSGQGVLALMGGLLRGMGDPKGGYYQTNGLPNGSYDVVSQPLYLNRVTVPVTLNNAPGTANLNLSVDPGQDVYAPFAYGLDPPQNAVLGTCAPAFSVYLSDGVLGAGIGGYSVTLDLGPV